VRLVWGQVAQLAQRWISQQVSLQFVRQAQQSVSQPAQERVAWRARL
jgi:hypothetical protein